MLRLKLSMVRIHCMLDFGKILQQGCHCLLYLVLLAVLCVQAHTPSE